MGEKERQHHERLAARKREFENAMKFEDGVEFTMQRISSAGDDENATRPFRDEQAVGEKLIPESAVMAALHTSPKLSCDDRIEIIRHALRAAKPADEGLRELLREARERIARLQHAMASGDWFDPELDDAGGAPRSMHRAAADTRPSKFKPPKVKEDDLLTRIDAALSETAK